MIGTAKSNPIEDPLLYDYPLELRKDYYPLGLSISIATNSDEILAAADESWGLFQQRFPNNPIRIRAAVSDSERASELPAPVVRAQGNLISFIGDAENFSIGDLTTGFGYSWVTQAVARRHGFLRFYYLDSLILTLMDALYVSTIHAACVVLNGRGVLLCGDSGAGKSSLAYACAQEGWDYMCDDSCSLLRDRKDRTVIGNPYSLRLRPDAGRLFPEFKQRLAASRPNGKMSFEIATSNELPIKLVHECQAHFIVFLEREDNAIPSIYPLPKERALEAFAKTISFGSAEYRRSRVLHYRNLLDLPVFALRYSNLESAVDRLSRMVRSIH